MDMNEFIESQPAATVTGDEHVSQLIEIAPLTGDTDGPCTTAHDSEVDQDILQQIKQEPDEVLCVVTMIKYKHCV